MKDGKKKKNDVNYEVTGANDDKDKYKLVKYKYFNQRQNLWLSMMNFHHYFSQFKKIISTNLFEVNIIYFNQKLASLNKK